MTTRLHNLRDLMELKKWLDGEMKRLKQKQRDIMVRYDQKKQHIIRQHIHTKIKDA